MKKIIVLGNFTEDFSNSLPENEKIVITLSAPIDGASLLTVQVDTGEDRNFIEIPFSEMVRFRPHTELDLKTIKVDDLLHLKENTILEAALAQHCDVSIDETASPYELVVKSELLQAGTITQELNEYVYKLIRSAVSKRAKRPVHIPA